jgi:molybdopterin-guanine dinucleotide biosynthesis protein A
VSSAVDDRLPKSGDTALILAGGVSSRFGGPKALTEFDGRPMVQCVFEAIAPLASQVVVSVASVSMADALRPLLPSAEFAIDGRHGTGPLEGIRRGCELAQGERLLVAPCDAPLLRAELYGLLGKMLGRHDAAVPKIEVLDPVRAVYRRIRVAEVLDDLPDLDSPTDLVKRLDFVAVGVDRIRKADPHLSSFLDVNTREDFEQALKVSRLGQ